MASHLVLAVCKLESAGRTISRIRQTEYSEIEKKIKFRK